MEKIIKNGIVCGIYSVGGYCMGLLSAIGVEAFVWGCVVLVFGFFGGVLSAGEDNE